MPYTYLIGWIQQNKFYYGVRYAANCHPDELMKTYSTSSSKVHELIETWGLPDVIQVRKKFDSSISARNWEHRVLRRLNVIQSDKWLNQTDNKAIAPQVGELNPMYGKTGAASPRFGMRHTEETKKIIGEKSKLKRGKMPEGFGERMSNIVRGRHHSESSKKLISDKLSGRTLSSTHKENISKNHADLSGNKNPFFGKQHSIECREKMKEDRKNRKWVNNPLTGERKLIHEVNVAEFLQNGWIQGKGK